MMLGGVIAVQQIEGHVLQPFLLGRLVRVHPLAVVLVIAVGALSAGIFGALIAVPLTAIVNAVGNYLAGRMRSLDSRRRRVCRSRGHEMSDRPPPCRVRLLRRAAERRQVDADQRAGRREGRHHVEQAADDAPGRARHRAPPGRAARCCWTPQVCTGRGRCWASGSTTRSAHAWAEVDVIGFCLPADEPIGPGDRFIAARAGGGPADAQGCHRDQDRPGGPRAGGRAADGGEPPRQTRASSGPRSCRCPRWRASRSSCSPPAARRCCRSHRRSIPRAS